MTDAEMDQSNGATLDPRIQEELERLNSASAEINKLEIQLDESRQQFRQTLTESTQQLNEKLKKCRKSAAKAQSYYIAREEARKAQERAQEAALRYQRASSMFQTAKETISIAEEAAITHQSRAEKKRQFDSALQEMLNLSTMKLNAAEQEKLESQREHEHRSQHYIATQQRVDMLAKKFKRSIANSASYYELKKSFFHEMNDLKVRTESLQKALHESKERYHGALKNLEQISEDIHQARHVAAILAESRQSGVGADSNTESEQEADKLNNPFHVDEKLDSSSVTSTDVESIASEPTSPAWTTPHSKIASRSISGSSMPSDESDVLGRRLAAGRGSVEGASGTFSRNSSLITDRLNLGNDDAENDEDDGDEEEDIVFGTEIDDDTDESDEGDLSDSHYRRKLRTISIGDLKTFSVFDGESDIDGSDAADNKADEKIASDDRSVREEMSPSVDRTACNGTAAAEMGAAGGESHLDVEKMPAEKAAEASKRQEVVEVPPPSSSLSSNDTLSHPAPATSMAKVDDDAIWI